MEFHVSYTPSRAIGDTRPSFIASSFSIAATTLISANPGHL